jgi:hypothetical protein
MCVWARCTEVCSDIWDGEGNLDVQHTKQDLTIGASGPDEIPTWFLPNMMQNATDTLTYSVTQLLSPLPASNILPEAVQIMIDSKVN